MNKVLTYLARLKIWNLLLKYGFTFTFWVKTFPDPYFVWNEYVKVQKGMNLWLKVLQYKKSSTYWKKNYGSNHRTIIYFVQISKSKSYFAWCKYFHIIYIYSFITQMASIKNEFYHSYISLLKSSKTNFILKLIFPAFNFSNYITLHMIFYIVCIDETMTV
jgi:hypothetical protein